MQTLTFTPKLLRQRRFFSSLIPLLALFLGLGASQSVSAQGYTFSNITITAKTTTAAASTTQLYYGTRNALGQNAFNGVALGGTSGGNAIKFDPANGGILTLDAASFRVNGTNPGVSSTIYQYRVYLVGTVNKPLYSIINLADQGNNIDFANPAAGVNLLTQPSVLGGGDYVVEIQAGFTNTDPFNGNRSFSDPSGVIGNMATFSLVAPLVTPSGGTSTWISRTLASGGTGSMDWAIASNWSNGVPNQQSNAIIPDKLTSPNSVYPILDDINYVYAVNNLTLSGGVSEIRAELTIELATLSVFGDLIQPSSGLKGGRTGPTGVGVADATQNSTIIFAGANQIISGRVGVPDIIIAGSGTKSVVNILAPLNTLSFRPTSVSTGAIVQTANITDGSPSFDTSGNPLIDLGSSGIINLTSGSEETISSYVRGVLRSTHTLVAGTTQAFGNSGLQMTPNHSTGSPVIVFRYVGSALAGPSPGSKPIRRRFEILGDDNNSASTSDIVFRYLPSANELNGITEANLVMFRTVDNGIPYVPLGGVVNTTTHVVTRANLASLSRYILVLGDKENPLPVRLTAFNVKRVGTDALVTWETASELNSRGYEVQVSTTGKEFRTLASVASAAPNTDRTTQYRYIDTEANKTGTRYYRLRQIDLDGKEAFFNPVAVSFTGKAIETALVAYPNPLNGNEQLHLTFQSASAGKGQISITDMTGRMVRQQSIDVTIGTSDLTVEKLGDLKMGMYLVRLTLPSGQVQNLKVVKQ